MRKYCPLAKWNLLAGSLVAALQWGLNLACSSHEADLHVMTRGANLLRSATDFFFFFFLWAKVGPQSMLMRNRSPVSHVLHRTPLVQLALLHQREFLVLEVNNLGSHNSFLRQEALGKALGSFFFIYFCGGAGRFYGILVYVLTRACVAQSILLLLLSGLLLIQIPLRFKLKLEN